MEALQIQAQVKNLSPYYLLRILGEQRVTYHVPSQLSSLVHTFHMQGEAFASVPALHWWLSITVIYCFKFVGGGYCYPCLCLMCKSQKKGLTSILCTLTYNK